MSAYQFTDIIECGTCAGAGKVEHEAVYTGVNPHSACIETCEDCDGTGEVPNMVALAACPPGLFVFNGVLGFRSEYGDDAYVVASGEFFWGGAKTREARKKLLVLPVNDGEVLASIMDKGEADA